MQKLTYLLLVLLVGASCSQSGVSLTLKGFDNDTVVVAHVAVEDYPDVDSDSSPLIAWDTLVAKNGKLEFRPDGRLSYYLIYPIEIASNTFNIFIDPEDCLRIVFEREGGIFSCDAEGSVVAEGVTSYLDFLWDCRRMIDSTGVLLERRPGDRELARFYNSLYDKKRELAAEWVGKHLDHPATVLAYRQLDYEDCLKYYPLLSEELRRSEYASYLDIAKRRAEEYMMSQSALRTVREGGLAPDFTLPDSTGKTFSLSQLRGKWVVLDFWGTWCGWCVREIPDMKEYEAKYRNKCLFVSINCNEKREAWLAGLEKYRMSWLQLYEDPQAESPQKAHLHYGLQAFPTKFIIRPDGTIHKVFVGGEATFYEELDRLFQ